MNAWIEGRREPGRVGGEGGKDRHEKMTIIMML